MKHFDDIENFIKASNMTKEELFTFRRDQYSKLYEVDKELYYAKLRLTLERENTLYTIKVLDLLLKENKV